MSDATTVRLEEVATTVRLVGDQATVVRFADTETVVVATAELGPQGPTGPIGPAGAAGGTYLHTQTVPASTWIVDHNLGKYPAAIVIVAGEEVDADIAYPSVNRTTVVHATPLTGLLALT